MVLLDCYFNLLLSQRHDGLNYTAIISDIWLQFLELKFPAELFTVQTICEVSRETMERSSSGGHSRALETLVPPET